MASQGVFPSPVGVLRRMSGRACRVSIGDFRIFERNSRRLESIRHAGGLRWTPTTHFACPGRAPVRSGHAVWTSGDPPIGRVSRVVVPVLWLPNVAERRCGPPEFQVVVDVANGRSPCSGDGSRPQAELVRASTMVGGGRAPPVRRWWGIRSRYAARSPPPVRPGAVPGTPGVEPPQRSGNADWTTLSLICPLPPTRLSDGRGG